jgi:hypothetical protein
MNHINSRNAKIALARQKRGADSPILRNGKSAVSKEILEKAFERWNKRKGYRVVSTDKVTKRGPPTAKIATRFLLKELMAPTKKFGLGQEEKKVLETLILERQQFVPGTNINLRQNPTILFVKLANRLGEKKAEEVLKRIEKRAININKLYLKRMNNKENLTDIIPNVTSDIWSKTVLFKTETSNKKQLINRMNDIFMERRKDLEKIKTSNLPEKEKQRLTHLIRDQMREIINEKTVFSTKHGLFRLNNLY